MDDGAPAAELSAAVVAAASVDGVAGMIVRNEALSRWAGPARRESRSTSTTITASIASGKMIEKRAGSVARPGRRRDRHRLVGQELAVAHRRERVDRLAGRDREIDRDDLAGPGPGEELLRGPADRQRRPAVRRGDRLDVAGLDVALELDERPAAAERERRSRRPGDRRRSPPDGDPGPAEDDEQEDERQAGGHSRALPDGSRWGARPRRGEGGTGAADRASCDGPTEL